jgi:hypothetical protein
LRTAQVDGGQVVDTGALAADDADEHVSMEHTRLRLEGGSYLLTEAAKILHRV